MNRPSRVLVAAALALSVGCFGNFNLTRKLWNFNNTVSPNKWVKELVYLALAIVPVYAVCAIGDALIFNSIEFWTGSNPITAMNDGKTQVIATRTGDGLHLDVMRPGEPVRSFDISVTADGAMAREGATVISSVSSGADGVIVRDASGRVVLRRSAADLDLAARTPRTAVARLLEQSDGRLIADAR